METGSDIGRAAVDTTIRPELQSRWWSSTKHTSPQTIAGPETRSRGFGLGGSEKSVIIVMVVVRHMYVCVPGPCPKRPHTSPTSPRASTSLFGAPPSPYPQITVRPAICVLAIYTRLTGEYPSVFSVYCSCCIVACDSVTPWHQSEACVCIFAMTLRSSIDTMG